MPNSAPQKIEDLYFTTRLLMMCYWLTCPTLVLMFFGLLYLFPKSNWTTISNFFKRYLFYIKNLSGFAWIILGIVLVINSVAPWFYLIDIAVLGNHSKYSAYWISSGNDHPLIVFFSIIGFGYLLYLAVAVISYKRYWILSCGKPLSEILLNR